MNVGQRFGRLRGTLLICGGRPGAVEDFACADEHGRPERRLQISDVPFARRGFTLAEATICTLIVGVMVVAALQMVGVSVRSKQVITRLGQDHVLVVGLMSEILQAPYEEALEPTLTEGSEIQFDSSVAAAGGLDVVVDGNKRQGQYIKPTLPADAVSWSVTRVKVSAAAHGPSQDGVTQVQMRKGDASGLPVGPVLDEVTLLETALLPKDVFAWRDIYFTAVSNLMPNEGVCLTFTAEMAGAMQVQIVAPAINPPGNGKLLGDSGGNWTLDTGKALRFYVFGKVSNIDSSTPPFGLDSPESSSSRADYDDVDDYDNWSASPPEDRDGNPLTGYSGWTRAAKVEYVAPDDPNGPAVGNESGLKRITVTVTDPDGRERSIVAYRAKSGVYAEEVTLTKTYTSCIGLTMQISDDVPIFTGTDLLNEPASVTN